MGDPRWRIYHLYSNQLALSAPAVNVFLTNNFSIYFHFFQLEILKRYRKMPFYLTNAFLPNRIEFSEFYGLREITMHRSLKSQVITMQTNYSGNICIITTRCCKTLIGFSVPSIILGLCKLVYACSLNFGHHTCFSFNDLRIFQGVAIRRVVFKYSSHP
jgi:hypothetical protein